MTTVAQAQLWLATHKNPPTRSDLRIIEDKFKARLTSIAATPGLPAVVRAELLAVRGAGSTRVPRLTQLARQAHVSPEIRAEIVEAANVAGYLAGQTREETWSGARYRVVRGPLPAGGTRGQGRA